MGQSDDREPVPISRRLGIACRQARRDAGLTQDRIAAHAGVRVSVINAFETQPGWRRKTDEIVAAYELECGLERDSLWRRALDG
jgi:ribosome-binding protein aMBF1 (putative translation factor)